MIRSRTAIAVLTSAAALVALSACASSGASASGSSASSASAGASSSASASAAAKTYTAADLPAILTKAEKSLGVSGTVLDNAQVQAEISKLGSSNALSKLLAMPGSSISPASCKDALTSALSVAPPANSISSILTFGTTAVTVSSESGKQLPSSITSDAQAKEQKLLSSCGNIKLTVAEGGQSETIAITLKKADVSTTADRTSAVEEQLMVPQANGSSTPISAEVVSAVKGNLVITAEIASTATTAAATSGASSAATPSASQLIDAVVAAAK